MEPIKATVTNPVLKDQTTQKSSPDVTVVNNPSASGMVNTCYVFCPDKKELNSRVIAELPETGQKANENKLKPVPARTLQDGTVIDDYSQDKEFATRMKSMSLDESEKIKKLVNQYPDEYPMPCMGITAVKIKEAMDKLTAQFDTTEEDREILLSLGVELKKLTDIPPKYCYKQSLIITYKALIFFSLFVFREQLKSIPEQNYDIQTVSECEDLVNLIGTTGVRRASLYRKDCTLNNLAELPWSTMLEKKSSHKRFSALNISLHVVRTTPDFITKLIEQIRTHRHVISEIGVNINLIITLLRLYVKGVPVDTLKKKTLDTDEFNKLIMENKFPKDSQKEVQWILGFFETDASLSSKERCKKAGESAQQMQ